MKNKQSKVTEWMKEHIRPHVRWNKYTDEDKASWSSLNGIKDNIKNHGVIGIKFRWRF